MTPTIVDALRICQRVNFIPLPPRVGVVPTRDSAPNKECFSSLSPIFFNQIAPLAGIFFGGGFLPALRCPCTRTKRKKISCQAKALHAGRTPFRVDADDGRSH